MALKDWAQAHRFAGSGDRGAIGTLVHDALRNKSANCWLLDADTNRAAVMGAALAQWGHAPDGLKELLAGDSHAPELLSTEEIALVVGRLGETMPDAVRANCPEWLQARFAAAFGDNWADELAAMATRPPLDLRANRLKTDRTKVLATLERQGAQPCDLSPDGVRIMPASADARLPNVTAEPAFARGLFEVQDQGSQIAAQLCDARPGMQVLDYCAGAGGKSLALAAAMNNKGQIFAHDGDSRRLSPMVERVKRAGVRNIQLCDTPAKMPPLLRRMDRVVVDAPCTGTGTWRRRPDIKWRLTPDLLAQRMADQDLVLRDAAPYVKPGGTMTYITCSLLPDENADRISAFLAEFDDFAPMAMADQWAVLMGQPVGDRAHVSGHGLTLTPLRSGTDGFFVCTLLRNP